MQRQSKFICLVVKNVKMYTFCKFELLRCFQDFGCSIGDTCDGRLLELKGHFESECSGK